MKSLAVVIPTYNDGERLARAVRSALALGPQVTSVIVVDDGGEPAASLDLDDDRLKVLRQENAGPGPARNRGIEAALKRDAQWIIFLDADDELDPDAMMFVNEAAEHDVVAGVGGRIEINPDGRPVPKPAPKEWADSLLPRPGDVFRPIQLFATTGMLVRADTLKQTGVRFDPIPQGQDRDFLRRLADHGRVWVSSQTVVRYTKHPHGGNVSGHRHVASMVHSFLTVAERHCDNDSERHFREAATHLLNQCAKHDVPEQEWRLLIDLFRRRGWPLRKRTTLRRFLRRLLPAGSSRSAASPT